MSNESKGYYALVLGVLGAIQIKSGKKKISEHDRHVVDSTPRLKNHQTYYTFLYLWIFDLLKSHRTYIISNY